MNNIKNRSKRQSGRLRLRLHHLKVKERAYDRVLDYIVEHIGETPKAIHKIMMDGECSITNRINHKLGSSLEQ